MLIWRSLWLIYLHSIKWSHQNKYFWHLCYIFKFLTHDVPALMLKTSLYACLSERFNDLSIYIYFNELSGINIFENYGSVFISSVLFSCDILIIVLQTTYTAILLDKVHNLYMYILINEFNVINISNSCAIMCLYFRFLSYDCLLFCCIQH